jgi:hypothetical protein
MTSRTLLLRPFRNQNRLGLFAVLSVLVSLALGWVTGGSRRTQARGARHD